MENDLINLNIHKSHPPRSFGLYILQYFNISKYISNSVLFFITSVCFFFRFAGFIKIIVPRVGF